MKPYYEESGITIYHGDCREVMQTLEANSIDALVCDPPYGLEFMGKEWDKLGAGVEATPKSAGGFGKDSPTNENAFAAARVRYGKSVANMQEWHRSWAVEALRILKPGAHALVFGGTRTHHRLMCGLEDAGFEIRDCVMWVYGSGFPKSLDVSKAIDKANGKHERDLRPFGEYIRKGRERKGWTLRELDEAMGTNTAASWWEGRKSGIQPPGLEMYERLKAILELDDRYDELIAWAEAEREKVGEKIGYKSHYGGAEPASRTFDLSLASTDEAREWEGWGTALKPAWEPIVIARKPIEGTVAENVLKYGTGALNIEECRIGTGEDKTNGGCAGKGRIFDGGISQRATTDFTKGRWPANLIHDGSDEVVSLFPDAIGQQGNLTGHDRARESPNGCFGKMAPAADHPKRNDSGSAARFFYTPKASGSDRGNRTEPAAPLFGVNEPEEFCNTHPTVKPIALMEYLIKLVTRPDSLLLDCFLGSGSTLVAAKRLGRSAIGIEQDIDSCKIAVERITRPAPRTERRVV